jgi:hypothetical protein
MDDQQLKRFGEAVEEKKQRSKEASERSPAPSGGEQPVSGDQASLVEDGRPQDTRDERKKNSGHGKKTADKWNQ